MALIASGCAGAGAGTAGERCATTAKGGEMRTQLRRDRHTIRNLENEISLLRAQLRERPAGWRGTEPPLAPQSPPAEAPPAAQGEPLPQEVAESLYGDVEIVYEGEAARQSKVRPRIELHETSRSSEGLTATEGDEAAPPPAPIPDVGVERLPVVPDRIPTVDEQIRRARSATAAGAPASRPSSAPGPAPVAPAPGPAAVTEAAPAPAVQLSANPMAEYRRYTASLKKGNHDHAVAGLRAFLSRFPDHYLADNVQYSVAESYYGRKLYRVALGEYQKVVERHWRGNKLPDALLKIGLCQLALGKPETGRASLRRLVARFPRTRPAKLARTRLQELEQK